MASQNERNSLFASDPSRMPWFLPLAMLTVYLLFRSYTYGGGDHDDFLPYLLHLLDPALLASDWFVSTLSDGIGHRTGFIWLAYLPSLLIGPEATFALYYIVAWFFMASALYRISYHLYPDRIAATFSVVAMMLLTYKFTLGSNDLVHSQLTPSFLAWTLGLWAIVMFFRSRPFLSGLLLGLSACIQALVGLQLALIIGILMIWDRESLRTILTFSIAFLLSSAIGVAPIVIDHLNAVEVTPSIYLMLFEFRGPHHYLPTRFVGISALGFASLLIVGSGCLMVLEKKQRSFPIRALIIVSAICLISFIGVEFLHSEFIGKLQLFKTTVVAKIVLVIAVCAGISRLLPSSVKRVLNPFYEHSHYTLAGVALITLALLIASPNALGLRPLPTSEDSPAQEQVISWARTSTPTSAVFATPPSWDSFRSSGERGIVVSFKSFPFSNHEAAIWFERIMDMAPITIDEDDADSMWGVLPKLDEAFYSLSADDLRELSLRYGFDYAIRNSPFEVVPEDFTEVFRAKDLLVYQLGTSDS